jgi:PleD family two-component response regulator
MERKEKRKILVVDDHEDNIELLRARLEARGYEVYGANDGQEALDQVGQLCPDLILLDVMMPKMDGMEVVRRLKSNPNLPFIPVIMQTALDSTENKVEGLDAGADDYITKPINFAELEARVNSLLRIKTLQSDLAAREKELSELNDRLRQISLTDGLTQVENRADRPGHVRHRQVQERERQPRPPGWRRGAQGFCAASQGRSPRDRSGRALRGRGIPAHSPGHGPRLRRDLRRAAAGEGRGA